MLLTLIVFLLLLSVLVLIHELGHFLMARKFGIKVEEFGFGLPPRLWGKQIGETLYSINWLPIGGFVKLFGEDEAGGGRVVPKQQGKMQDIKRAFFSHSIMQRALVIVAGVVMNTLLAAVIYYVFLVISGFKTELPLLNNYNLFFGVNHTVKTDVIVTGIAKDSPAYRAGIKPNVKVIAINGQDLQSASSFRSIISANKGKAIVITWQDTLTQKLKTALITPRVNPPKGQGALGVEFFPLDTVILSYDTPSQKIASGFIHPANLMLYNLVVIKSLVNVSIQQKTVTPLSQGVSGPVGIYSIVGTIVHIPDAKERILQILNLAGLLSISLAFFNLLPIPGLDGGRFFFILVEAVTRKKVNPKIEGWIHAAGMIFLIGLIILVTIKDINQFFK